MLKHERKDLCLPGNALYSLESAFLVPEIKRIAHGGEQGMDAVVTLKLF